jgi:hypothetical protein
MLEASLTAGVGVVPKKCSQNRMVVELDPTLVSPSEGGGKIDVVFCLPAFFAALLVFWCLLPIAAAGVLGVAFDLAVVALLLLELLSFGPLALLSIYAVLFAVASTDFFLVYFLGGSSPLSSSSRSPRLFVDADILEAACRLEKVVFSLSFFLGFSAPLLS